MGGVAVNLHNVVRATMDLDLIVHLDRNNILRFIRVLKRLGYRPKAPVNPLDFSDPAKRKSWILEKGLVVLSFFHSKNPLELIDVFVREPMPFQKLYRRRKKVKAFGISIPVIGLKDLITLKKKAGRDKDIYDIRALKRFAK